MIVITGASGHYGRQVIDELLQVVPPSQIGASVRHPEKVAALAERGVRVRQGDFADPASLRAVFDGAEQVLIVSVNAFGEEAVRQHGAAIAAAKDAGAKRILYTSHQWADEVPIFVPSRDNHAPTEQLLRDSGVPFVSLRNGFYAESALFQLAALKHTHEIALPADGPTCWTARADLAVAAAKVLVNPGLLDDGISPPLTGSELLDFADIAGLASQILGVEVQRRITSLDEYKHVLMSHGLPAPVAEGVTTLFTAAQAAEFAETDPTLERLLGRKATTMREVLAKFLTEPGTKIFQ